MCACCCIVQRKKSRPNSPNHQRSFTVAGECSNAPCAIGFWMFPRPLLMPFQANNKKAGLVSLEKQLPLQLEMRRSVPFCSLQCVSCIGPVDFRCERHAADELKLGCPAVPIP